MASSDKPDPLNERLKGEMIWVHLHNFFERHGYRMRPRYHPDWVGSWVNDPKILIPLMCEDGIWPIRDNVLDAIRVKDGAPVIMKLIDLDNDKSSLPMMQYFSEESRRMDARNHCIPLLELLRPDDYPTYVIMVQPRLVPWDIWPFRRVDEIVDFLGQLFEGIAFMHENNVAHLDASWSNVMMDGLHLFLEPNHPCRPECKASGEGKARHIHRHEATRPIKYCFIDFDQSIRFSDATARRLVRRQYGQDDSVPEERSPEPYDPFKLDIYCIGNMILIHLLNAYRNVEFIRPLAEHMMRENPNERPTAQQVVEAFDVIRRSLSPRLLKASPQHIRSYDFIEYILGNVPARRPPRKLTDIVSGLWRARRVRTRSTPKNGSGTHAGNTDGDPQAYPDAAPLRPSQSLS